MAAARTAHECRGGGNTDARAFGGLGDTILQAGIKTVCRWCRCSTPA